jgi:hypothetical protein
MASHVTAASAAAAANPASAVAASSSGILPFRNEAADPGFPWAGALLLLVLVLVAVAARWQAARRQGMPATTGLARWLRPAVGTGLPANAHLRIESSLRLDAQTQLHTVAWGERRLLLATSSHAAPVVLDRVGQPESGLTGDSE